MDPLERKLESPPLKKISLMPPPLIMQFNELKIEKTVEISYFKRESQIGFLRCRAPGLPIPFIFSKDHIFARPSVINYPKQIVKRATVVKLTRKKCEEEQNASLHQGTEPLDEVGPFDFTSDLNILVTVYLKTVDFKSEFDCSSTGSLADIKKKFFVLFAQNFQNQAVESLAESTVFNFQRKCVPLEDEGLPFVKALVKNDLERALVGNILTLDLKIVNPCIQMNLIERFFLNNPPRQNEKLRAIVRLQKLNNKLKTRILILNIQHTSSNPLDPPETEVIFKKVNGSVVLRFPQNAIKFCERAELQEDVQKDYDLQNNIFAKVTFINQLEWSDMFILFWKSNDYMQFLFDIIESSGLEKQSEKRKSLSIDVVLPTKIMKKDSQEGRNDQNIGKIQKPLTLNEVLKQNKEINFYLDAIKLKNKRLYLNEDPKGSDKYSNLELELFNKSFPVTLTGGGMLGGVFNKFSNDNKKTVKISKDNLEIQFYQGSNANKFLYSYMLREVQGLTKEGEKKLTIVFKNQKRYKNVPMSFASADDLKNFNNIFDKLSQIKAPVHKSSGDEKEFLNKKRYSWLCQPVNPFLTSRRNSAEYSFNIINETDNPPKQILHLNFIHEMMTFLKKDETVLKQFSLRKIVNLENCYKDTRKTTIVLEKKKYIDIIFSSVKEKLIFDSAINSILFSTEATNKTGKLPKKLDRFKVYTTTWNVGMSEPPGDIAESEDNFLHQFNEYDIVAIGLQECKTNTWIDKFQSLMKSQFDLISVMTMWRMMICVYIKKEHSALVKKVEAVQKPTGIGKIIGNKGGVMITFKVCETSFCFLSCHLAAKPGNEHIRRANYMDLIKHLRTGIKEIETIFQFDYVFWMGDMNFRLDYPFDKVVDLVGEKNFDYLKEHCQLNKARNANLIFSDFCEANIDFKPTYRRKRDTSEVYSNKKNQSPSWTDRIFIRSQPNKNMNIIEYNSKEMQLSSDHRPVFAILELEIELPYFPSPPLHCRHRLADGIIKLNEITVEYDFKTLFEISDYSAFSFPLEISINFYAGFLNNQPYAHPIFVENVEQLSLLKWGPDQLPSLICALSDLAFLKNKLIYVIVSIQHNQTDIVIGQAYMILKDLIKENGEKTKFDEKISVYGRIFGNITGEMEFEME